MAAFYALLLSLLIAIIFFALILKKIRSSKLWNNVVLKDSESSIKGFSSSLDYSSLLGKKGVVIAKLRPAGSIEIAEQKIDVISQGEFIDIGVMVEIVEIIGNKIIVKKI